MRNRFSAVPASLIALLMLTIFIGACKQDPCETEICQPCPSSRIVMQYLDSAGACVPSFHAAARVYALHSATNDTLYSYGFSDSCEVGFLIADSVVYHLVSTAHGIDDVIALESWEFQDPVSVTECCLCYPVEHVHGMLNNSTLHVEFPAGQYESTPVIRTF